MSDADPPPAASTRTYITDEATFAEFTRSPNELAGLYAFQQLDGLIELAALVASDFFARPQLYTRFQDDETATLLARLHARLGSDELFMSTAQRQQIFGALFGESTSDFSRLRDGLLESAQAFAEWSQATGIPMLRERVRTAHRPFKEYLNGLAGAQVSLSRTALLPAIADAVAYRIIRDGGVASVFGVTVPPGADWPYVEDSNGDKVVEEISARLGDGPTRSWSRERFGAVQRVAFRGAEAIYSILRFDSAAGSNDELSDMITRCYTWHAALLAVAA